MTAHRLSVPVAVGVGLLATFAGFATGQLVGGFISPGASPFLAVGASAIDLTPSWLKDFAVEAFGTYDKIVLLVGMALVLGALGVAAGLVSRRSSVPGLALIAALSVLAGAAVISRPSAGSLDVISPLIALIISAGTFTTLHRLGGQAAPATGEGAPVLPRRRLLTASTAIAAGAGVATVGGQLLAGRGGVDASRQVVGRIVPQARSPRIPASADFAAEGTPTFLTPNRDFYRVDVNLALPRLRAEDWRLRIHGMVNREVTINWAELTSRTLIERPVTLTCVSNEIGGPYISTATFTGVPLAEILAEVGVAPGAEQALTSSVDGWTCGTPAAALTDPAIQAMLVIGMNGEPLPIEHGFPVRMIVPGLYGFVSATKWITDMEFTTFDARQAYWYQRGWAQRAPVKTMSRIDSPGSFERVSPDTPITGVAWAPRRGVEKVEVRLDHGEWRLAELASEVNVDTWRMFRLRGRWRPGAHVAEARATDRTGYVQAQDRASPIPDGATGWHSVQFTVQ